MMDTNHLNQIAVIQMGGTIDKDYPRAVGGYAFEIGDPAVKRVLSRAKLTYPFHIYDVCRKDSQEITLHDRQMLAQKCKEIQSRKILITHGTDTLLDTALFLKQQQFEDKVIILTGAFKPETFKDSDADFNVGVAIGALQCLTVSDSVYVAMNGCVYACDQVERNMETGQFIVKNK